MSDVPRELEVTVAICTRNRAPQLAEMLTSMVGLETPDGLEWELLVVDNGSTDGTRQVVEGFADRLPTRWVLEPEAGLSNARNRAATEARGRYICWTDDDVVVDRRWLAAYVEAFRAHPDADVFGGKVLPQLQGPTPAWFGELADRWPLTVLLAKRDFGDQPQPLDLKAGRTPWGANYALRTAAQRQHRYDPQLGVSPNHKRLGEEAEVIFQIMSAGGTGWWTPGSKVTHIIPTRRQTVDYVHEYFFSSGETLAYLEATYSGPHHMAAHPSQALASEPSWRLKARRLVASVGYRVAQMAGLKLRSLYFQKDQAVVGGILAYRRAHP